MCAASSLGPQALLGHRDHLETVAWCHGITPTVGATVLPPIGAPPTVLQPVLEEPTEAPWVKVEPLAQEMGVPTALTSAEVGATERHQKAARMAAMANRSELALLETWITMSWLFWCQRACNVSRDMGLGVEACEHLS